MGKISYSQISQWDKCPHMWKLNYIDKVGTFDGNIHTVFGTAVHETIQAYLVAYYNKTIKEADNLPLHDILKYRMEENFKKSQEGVVDFPVTLDEMKQFYIDGCSIIDEFLKRKSGYFPKKNHELLGIEMELEVKLPNNINFVGFMDVVLHDKNRGRIKIIDIKTSTMGWNKYMKADKNKTNQLLLYKQFFAKQENIPVNSIDIEYLILKRKLYENMDFPQKRIQTFSPASGTPSINKVLKRMDEFIKDSFDQDGNYNIKEYRKEPSTKNCKWCEFKSYPELCDRKP